MAGAKQKVAKMLLASARKRRAAMTITANLVSLRNSQIYTTRRRSPARKHAKYAPLHRSSVKGFANRVGEHAAVIQMAKHAIG